MKGIEKSNHATEKTLHTATTLIAKPMNAKFSMASLGQEGKDSNGMGHGGVTSVRVHMTLDMTAEVVNDLEWV